MFTACLGDTALRFIRFVAPLGRRFGVMPLVRVFAAKELDAGFNIECQWRPGKGKAVFMATVEPA